MPSVQISADCPPSKNKSKIADRLAILEAEIISYLTNLFGNPTAYWELVW